MAIETNTGHVLQAIDFSNKTDLFIELAKSTAWSDPKNPDNEVATTTDLEGSQAFLRVSSKFLVYEGDATTEETGNDTNSYIIYKGHKWMISNADKAIADDANYVLVEATLNVGALDPFIFAQIGVRQGSVFSSSIKNQSYAKASDVTKKGNLLFYENRQMESYTDATAMNIKYLLRF